MGQEEEGENSKYTRMRKKIIVDMEYQLNQKAKLVLCNKKGY